MTEWRSVPLGEFAPLVYGRGLPASQRDQGGAVPVYGSNGVVGRHSCALVPGRGIVVGRKGSVGEVHYSADPFWPIDTAFYITDDPERDVRFTYYALRNLRLQRLSGDSAVPGLNREAAHREPLLVPSVEMQRRIAAVLGSLDDLIENNRRRVAVLEDVARAIYREWFVRFRYPGNNNHATLVDSPLGSIPTDWSVRSLGELAVNQDRHRRPLSKAQRQERPGSFPYYGAAKLIDWIDGWIFDGEFLLFAEDGTVQTPDGFPVLQLVEGKFWANNHTHVLEGTVVSTRFLYLAAAVQPITGYVTGSAQPKITQANLNRLPLVVGPPELHQAFDAVVDPLFDEWRRLQATNVPLASVRDLLLPKLVTGQIDVSALDLDALVEGAVA